MNVNDNDPWEDQWHKQAHLANDLEAAASMLEECRSAILAQRKSQLGDIADNRAERIVKASPEWMDYNKKMVEARQKANAAQIDADYMKMKYWTHSSDRADERTMARM